MRQPRPQRARAGIRVVAMVLIVGSTSPLRAEQTFIDRAPVLEVTPVAVRLEGSLAGADCDRPGRVPPARSHRPGITLAQALREDLALAHSRLDCRRVPATATAYRVRYEYGGRVYERRMPADPGDWVDVRVRVKPR